MRMSTVETAKILKERKNSYNKNVIVKEPRNNSKIVAVLSVLGVSDKKVDG